MENKKFVKLEEGLVLPANQETADELMQEGSKLKGLVVKESDGSYTFGALPQSSLFEDIVALAKKMNKTIKCNFPTIGKSVNVEPTSDAKKVFMEIMFDK